MKQPIPAYSHKENINLHPHVVILGAGASRAAFPNGDKNGKKLPLLNELVDIVGLESELKSLGVKTPVEDFETTFDQLSRTKHNSIEFTQIKDKIFLYFNSLELPDKLTLYDKLVLSLRPNDLIATFNWDPLLGLAFQRNRHLKKLPRLIFLHGNVFLGICDKHKIKGFTNCSCSKCGIQFGPTDLLYPVLDKDYDSNAQIKDEWNELRHRLEYAYIVTIFGYAAPKTDAAARKTLFEYWMKNKFKEFGQIQIINTDKRSILENTWNEFFIKRHYSVIKDFKNSYLNHFPRRSCEAFASATLYNDPWRKFKDCEGISLSEYQNLMKELIPSESLNKNLSKW